MHFDGKRINNKEYQAVCLKNSVRTLLLACKSGPNKDIIISMQALLDEYAWKSINIIISDTTAVNTGYQSRVVVRFQKAFRKKV